MAAPDRLKIGLPFRVVVEHKKEPYGQNGGHIDVYKLDCGHEVTHLFRPDLHVGSRTRCEQCK